MSEHVIVNDEEMVRIITMRRPEKKNTLTQDMYLAMSDAIESAQRNPSIRCLICGEAAAASSKAMTIAAISARLRQRQTSTAPSVTAAASAT